ncbi:MAG: M20/M25/M40 family metallo-hydrolase [Phycisphaerales bacterium]|nr:M20/M25/M40 family metallo-hydrolase [Phycisphaerales bacterium]
MKNGSAIERLIELCAIPSVSRAEDAIATRVADWLASVGLHVEREGNNVWCELGDCARPRLLLNSHLDTVAPGSGWTGDPWTPRQSKGVITALGANDAKGCVCAMLHGVLELHARLQKGVPLGGTVVLALTAEEEISGQGLGTVLPRLGPIDAALVGEPTGLIPMTAQRGLLILRLVARGRAGHPAHIQPDRETNAIYIAAGDMVALKAFQWGPSHPLLGDCHAHATQIQGGIARNVIPDACEIYVDVRTTPLQPHGLTVERLRAALKSEVHIHSDRLVPIETAAGAVIVEAVRDAILGAIPTGSPAMSDMVFLSGIPCVKIGPGEPQRSHTADEFILENELKAGVEAYASIVRRYFGRMR